MILRMNDDLIVASRTLRPTENEALDAWRTLVVAERTQVESLPERPRPEDFYAPVASRFRDDPRRTDDPSLDLVLSLVRPEDTWLDLGAGGGRYALPLALHCRGVVAVDPSPGMLQVLRQAMSDEGISNIEVHHERWPGPTAAPVADVGFIAHVSYDIEDIGPFLAQLEQHSARLCAALLFVNSPTSEFAALWEPVHGAPRVTLPGLRELTALLYARGRCPETRLIDLPPRTFESVEALHEAARRPTWVLPGSEKDAALRRACEQLAVAVEGGVALSPRPRTLGLVTWQPEAP